MNRFFYIFFVALIGGAITSRLESKQNLVMKSREELTPVQQLCQDYWNWRIQDMPEFATFVGIHDYDDLLDELSIPAFERRLEQVKGFLDRAIHLEETESFQIDSDSVNLKVLKDELAMYIEGYEYKGFYLPLSYLEGVHVDFEQRLLSWTLLESPKDYEKLLSRYTSLPKQLDQIMLLMKAGVQEEITNHDISMKGVADALNNYAVLPPEDSPLYAPFKQINNTNVTGEQIRDYQTRAKSLIETQIVPAFSILEDYVRNEYKTRSEIAVTSLPNGEAFYNQLIKFYVAPNLTAEEIHETGIEEVDRIETEMKKIIQELGHGNMSVVDFSDLIRNNASNFYNVSKELMEEFRNIATNRILPTLKKAFTDLPEAELLIVENPSENGGSASYLTGSYDGSRPGVFYVNTYNLDVQPKYDMLTLSLHEGNPGHHLQGSYSIENENIPFFRRVMEDRNYGTAPSHFLMYTAFVEGWGLYSESVGFDLDLFQDPLERYGHYSAEIFRACRLVVDTGMHAFNWTRIEAVDYMTKHTAMPAQDIENEVDRYITWPGQALGYKNGQLMIKELREKAQAQLGDKFDLKKFHDVLLSSVGTMDFVQNQVDEWLNSSSENIHSVFTIFKMVTLMFVTLIMSVN